MITFTCESNAMSEKIAWGIVGLGNIASKFAADLQLLPDGELVGVASRDRSKSERFASEFGALKAYGSYEELFRDPAVQVVYIATPHSFHLQHTLSALQAGKHVLCEKPLGISASQVDEMLKAAQANQCFLMEALWSRFNPSIKEVYSLLQGGSLGKIAYLHADFAFPALDRDPEGRLLNPALAGGSLLDIGIYPVFLAYLLLGVPETIRVSAHFHKTGVEKQIGMLFDYPEATALLYSGFSSRSEMKAEISCTRGTVYLSPPWHEAQSYEIQREDETELVRHPLSGSGYTYEIEEVHHMLRDGKLESQLWAWEDSRSLHGLLDRIRKEAGIEFPGNSE
jgi:predicted dehydrogenase